MIQALKERAQLLIEQGRFEQAREVIEEILGHSPFDYEARIMLFSILIDQGKLEEAQQLRSALIGEYPDDIQVISLAIHLDIALDKLERAESICEQLIGLAPFYHYAFILMARIKWAQRNYTKAGHFIDKALEIEPEDVEALNLKITLNHLDTSDSTQVDIDQALHLDPNNPDTLSNLGLLRLREGKVDEALEQFKQALSISPTNSLAQYGLAEALKSKFWIYNLFFRLQLKLSKLSAQGSWKLIIGIYLVYFFLRKLAKHNETLAPLLTPIVYVLACLFLLTWIFNPLMNLYLLTNPYGKYLLDKKEQNTAKLVGASLAVSVLCLLSWWFTDFGGLFLGTLLFFLFSIPLASFLSVENPDTAKKFKFYVMTYLVLAVFAIIGNLGGLMALLAISVFIYQWIINGVLIKENARVYD